LRVEKQRLAISRPGTEYLPGDGAIYLICQQRWDTLGKIDKHFGIDNFITVGSAVERINVQKKRNQLVQNHLNNLDSQQEMPKADLTLLSLLRANLSVHQPSHQVG